VKLITWNVNKKWRLLEDQIRFIASRSPDVVTLQEVTPRTGPRLLELLASRAGLKYGRVSILPGRSKMSPKRSLGVLIASRYLLGESNVCVASPWLEKALSTCVLVPEKPIELHTVHVPPGSSNGWVKVDVLESVFTAVARTAPISRILTGDFNTPQAEFEDGTVVTWAQRLSTDGHPRERRIIRGGPASRWDAAERNVLTGLGSFGIKDAFRSLHGYRHGGTSWVFRTHRGEVHRRFDHVLASEDLLVRSAEYLAEPVSARLSDHRPLEVVFGAGI
jgi:exonuclease III